MDREREERMKETMAAESKKGFRYVPEEIVLKILPKLPDCALLRFRCVSKQWIRFISAMKNTMALLSNIPFTKINQAARVEIMDDHWLLSTGASIPRVRILLLGSWEGQLLVLVDDDLYLWNPSNQCPKRVVSIRQCIISLIDPEIESFKSFDVIASGLCFDSVRCELKAVMALGSTYNNAKVILMVGLETKVTELIDFPFEFVKYELRVYYNYSLVSGPVVNKRLHWCIHSPSQQHILSFNPNADAKFVELPLPEGNFVIMGLGVLAGCLSMARRNQNCAGDEHLDVMGMRKYGLKESWEILFRISRGHDYYKDLVPLFYTRNKDEVLFKGMGGIFTYNTKYQTHKDIFTCGLGDNMVVVYEESLDHY